MAYVRKLPSGKFQATVRHPSGRRLTKTDPLKRAVQAWADELEGQFRRGVTDTETGRRTTVGQWATKWTAARRVEPNTAAKNESHMRVHVLPAWGDWPLSSIGRLNVQTWVKRLEAARVGPPTIHAAYNLLAGMLSDAVLEGLLTVSPCREVALPKVVKPEARWFTRGEYDRIQLALAVTPRAPVWQAYVALGCFSGLRPGELSGLDVTHVDVQRGLVRVGQVVTRHGVKGYGKTDAATRWAPFPDEVGRLLWALIADRGEGPVFPSARGLRVNESNFRNRVWRPALETAGVDYEDPYSMRHTCASWLAQAGVPDYEIAAILGHSSTRMLATYRHLDPTAHERVRAAWGVVAQSRDAVVTHGAKGKSPSPEGLGL